MDKDINLFILWAKGRPWENQVLANIKQRFNIIQTYEITWSENLFMQNLARFYGKKLPSAYKKKKLCGTGSFLAIAIEDPSPHLVNGINLNIHELKTELRTLLGDNYLHASDNQIEAEENLLFLTGMNLQELKKRTAETPNGSIIRLCQDVIGAPTWLDEDKLKNFLGKLPGTQLEYHSDHLFISTPNVKLLRRFLNARKPLFTLRRNCYHISLRGKRVPVYIKPCRPA